MLFTGLDRYRDEGLLLLRVGIGLMFLYHGAPKIFGGIETWTKLGAATKFIGIDFAPTFFGLMAALAEFGGGLLLILGLLLRPACVFLVINLTVAAALKFGTGAGLAGASQAIELGIVFLSLILIGPGKYSLDAKLAAAKGW
ncbi:MAG: DoxX family protein [Negativicutes bacterium]|nr:DoxX family protein [Negativicutes bacterium]